MKKFTEILTTIVLGTTFLATAQASLSPTEDKDLTFMIQEEKLAHDIYIKFGEKYSRMPFMNIPKSEQRHMDAISDLLTNFSLVNPNEGKKIGEFEDQDLQKLYNDLLNQGLANELAAFSVSALIEEKDIEDLHQVMKRTQNSNVISIYENLDCGSRNHLRAFSKFVYRLSGKPYKAQLLPQKEVDQIIESPKEQCGNGN